MCSHENITWTLVTNNVKDRMVENSLIHKFTASRKLRRRTKILNAEFKHCRIKDYAQYVEKKTNVLRRLTDDTDTDDTDNLSDVDYTIIYKSKSKLKKYVANKSKLHNYYSSETDEDACIKGKGKSSNSKIMIKEEHMNIGWQEATEDKKLILSNNQCTNILYNHKENNFQDDKCNSKICSTKQSLPLNVDSQNPDTVFYTVGATNKNITQSHREFNAIPDELNSQSDSQEDQMSCKTKSTDENIVQSQDSNTMMNESNSILNLQDDTISCKRSISKNILQSQSEAIIKESNLISNFSDKVSNKVKSASKVTVQNHKKSNTEVNEINFKSDPQDNVVSCTKSISRNTPNKHKNHYMTEKISESELDHRDTITNDTKFMKKEIESSEMVSKSNCSMNLEITNNQVALSTGLEIIVDSPLSINESESNELRDCNTEKVTKVDNEILINPQNYIDISTNRKSSKLLDNVKRNLISILDNVDHTNNNRNVEENQNEEDTSHCSQLCDSSADAVAKFSSNTLSPDQHKDSGIDDDSQDKYVKQFCMETEDDIKNITEKDFFQSNECNDMDTKINCEDDKMHFVKTKESCDTQEKQLKIMSTKVVNTRYKIVSDIHNNTNVKDKGTPIKLHTLTNSLNVTNNDIEDLEMNPENGTVYEKETTSTWFKEIDNVEEEEEDSGMNYMSPRTRKRLQQQARLNLIVDSDSSESDDGNKNHVIVEKPKCYIDSFDTSCNDNEKIKNGKTNCVPEENSKDISDSENVLEHNFTHRNKKLKNGHNIDEDICTNESEKLKSYRRDSIFEKWNKSSLDKKNIYDQSKHPNKSTCEIERQNVVPCNYRPCNLQELVEDQQLLTETLPASLTLKDVSEDEEVFFLNVPNKLLECDLQNQQILLEGETMIFGKTTYKVTRKNIDTISCIFATGKRRKPYKIVNIKEVSTVTIRERLSHQKKKSTKFHDTNISSESKLMKRRRRHSNREIKS